jgi:glycosyltransferase involved in cell wall biosynthesis
VHIHGGGLAPVLGFAPALRGVPVVVTCYAPASGGTGAPHAVTSVVEHRKNASPARGTASRIGGVALARHALRRGRVGVVCTPDARVEATYTGAGPVMRVCGAARLTSEVARWSPDPTIIFAGRAQTGRGVDELLAAFPTVQRAIPSARLRLMLLDGAAAARWRAHAGPGIEVSVGGSEDLARAYATSQVGAFPFRWSATLTPALAAAEAMATGLPVVATSVACLEPLVDHGVNGMVVPPEDPAALAAALIDVLRTEDSWRALSEGARKTIDTAWSWAGAADATRDAYAVARRGRRR